MVRPHLTQAERNLIVTLCQFITEERRALEAAYPLPFDDFGSEDWERVDSIILKLDTLDLDLYT